MVTPIKLIASYSFAIFSIGLILTLATYNVHGKYDPYISSPSNIPLFDSYKTPTIQPGNKGTLSFTITNRYENAMTNITLTIEIYKWATLEEAKTINKIKHPPVIRSVNIANARINTTSVEMHINMLPAGDNISISIHIKTLPDTPEGVYFVRTMLVFNCKNITNITMKSVGYFPRDLWDQATSEPGSLNLTLLNVSGIVPDTSFSVKDPHPLWQTVALATLITLIIVFLALAVIFYMIEEQGKEFRIIKTIKERVSIYLRVKHRKRH